MRLEGESLLRVLAPQLLLDLHAPPEAPATEMVLVESSAAEVPAVCSPWSTPEVERGAPAASTTQLAIDED